MTVLSLFDPQHIGSSRNHENGPHGLFLKRAGQTFMLFNYMKSIPFFFPKSLTNVREKRAFPLHAFHDWHLLDPTNYSSVSLPSGLLDGAQTFCCPLEGFNSNSCDCCSLVKRPCPLRLLTNGYRLAWCQVVKMYGGVESEKLMVFHTSQFSTLDCVGLLTTPHGCLRRRLERRNGFERYVSGRLR